MKIVFMFVLVQVYDREDKLNVESSCAYIYAYTSVYFLAYSIPDFHNHPEKENTILLRIVKI